MVCSLSTYRRGQMNGLLPSHYTCPFIGMPEQECQKSPVSLRSLIFSFPSISYADNINNSQQVLAPFPPNLNKLRLALERKLPIPSLSSPWALFSPTLGITPPFAMFTLQ